MKKEEIKKIQAFVKSFFSNTEAFIKFIQSHLEVVNDNYNGSLYLFVLNKIGIADVNEYLNFFCVTIKNTFELREDTISMIISPEMEQRENNHPTKNLEDFRKKNSDLLSPDVILPKVAIIKNEAEANGDKILEIIAKVKTLSESEIAIFNVYDLLFLKLFCCYMIKINPVPSKEMREFIKDSLAQFYKGAKALYGNQFVPEGLIEYIEQIELPYSEQPSIEVKTKIAPQHYTWKGNPNALKTIYRKLKEQKFIAKNTDMNTFLYFFTGKPENAKMNPIQWIESNGLLVYMLSELHEKKIILNEDWQSIAGNNNLFVNKKNKPLTTNNLSKALSNFKSYNPKKNEAVALDLILSKLIS